jgi:two-component system, cell cycle sensor histidine kinase and response regulator CckA
MVDRIKPKEQQPGDMEEFRRRLHEAEELCRCVFKLTSDAVAIYDMEGFAKYVNPSFTWTFGWTLDEVRGKRIEFVPESERADTAAVIQVIVGKGGSITAFETKRLTKDKRALDVSISASRYRDAAGAPVGIVVILRDITEQKRNEEALKKLNARS